MLPSLSTGQDADSASPPATTGSAESTTSSSSETTGNDTTTTSTSTSSGVTSTTELSTGTSTGQQPDDDIDPCVASPQALADCTDPAAYADDLQFIADIRTPGTPHWQAVQDLCADRLTELGYDVELHKYGTGVNVIGKRAGVKNPEQIVLLGAHYDHIADCHGADDNASGLAAVLEAARLLAKFELPRTVMIACWDEEEFGLLGSDAFAAAAAAVETDIVVNFNFDMIGFRSAAPNSQSLPPGFDQVFPGAYAAIAADEFRGDFIAIIASELAHEHALAYAAAADRIALPHHIIELPAGAENSPAFDDLRRSDHASFWSAGYPAVFLTDTGDFRNPGYHCLQGPDEVADLDLAFASEITRATVEASAVVLGL